MSGKVEGKKGTGTSFFLIYRRTFLALATMGVTSYHWTLQDTVFIGRKKAWVIPRRVILHLCMAFGLDSQSQKKKKAVGGW